MTAPTTIKWHRHTFLINGYMRNIPLVEVDIPKRRIMLEGLIWTDAEQARFFLGRDLVTISACDSDPWEIVCRGVQSLSSSALMAEVVTLYGQGEYHISEKKELAKPARPPEPPLDPFHDGCCMETLIFHSVEDLVARAKTRLKEAGGFGIEGNGRTYRLWVESLPDARYYNGRYGNDYLDGKVPSHPSGSLKAIFNNLPTKACAAQQAAPITQPGIPDFSLRMGELAGMKFYNQRIFPNGLCGKNVRVWLDGCSTPLYYNSSHDNSRDNDGSTPDRACGACSRLNEEFEKLLNCPDEHQTPTTEAKETYIIPLMVRCPREGCTGTFPRQGTCPQCGYPGLKALPDTCPHTELYEIRVGKNAGKLGCLAPGCKALFENVMGPFYRHGTVRITKGPQKTSAHAVYPVLWYQPGSYVAFREGEQPALVRVKEIK